MATKLIKPDKPFWMFSMEADTDYLLCRMINFLGSSFHARAGFFAQQACEKYMKALTIQDRSEYTEINNLVELAKFCEPHAALAAGRRLDRQHLIGFGAVDCGPRRFVR
jgi:HEPN domain